MFEAPVSEDSDHEAPAAAPAKSRKLNRQASKDSDASRRSGKGKAKIKRKGGHTKDKKGPTLEGAVDGDAPNKGRPPKDIPKYTRNLVLQFERADDTTMFFSESESFVTLRGMMRAAHKLSEDLLSKGDDKSRTDCRKLLQVMGEAVKLQRMNTDSGMQWRKLVHSGWMQLLP